MTAHMKERLFVSFIIVGIAAVSTLMWACGMWAIAHFVLKLW